MNKMKNEISIHQYTMTSSGSLNAKSARSAHCGALVRVNHEGVFGYGSLHPWPELGDESLDESLAMLAEGHFTALSSRTMQCTRDDAAARGKGISLFQGLVVPRSHATLMMEAARFEAAVQAGFTTVKVKVGRSTEMEARFIREQAKLYPDLMWRLDFNGSLDADAVESFLTELGEEVRDKIDFLEDAFLPGITPWINALGPYDIPMAVDREVEDACGGYGVAVIKPALNEPMPILERILEDGKRAVITSYMDHPVGQSFAAWEAARAFHSFPDVVDTCGLITHGLFEQDEFIAALGEPRPYFMPASGTGLGFDDLLESLSWTPLS
jgi:O-succinylbenzoate synthase